MIVDIEGREGATVGKDGTGGGTVSEMELTVAVVTVLARLR